MCMHARMRRLVWSGDGTYVRRHRPWPARGKICPCAFLVNMYIHTHNRMNIFIQFPLKLNIAAGAWLERRGFRTSVPSLVIVCSYQLVLKHNFSMHDVLLACKTMQEK